MITRPYDAARRLQAELKALAIDSDCLPTIDFIARQYTFATDAFQRVIFTSAAAVDYFACEKLKGARLFAIGPATAQALVARGLPVEPLADKFTSEGLLAHPALQAVAKSRIAIVGGLHPRQLLQQALADRGADVQFIAVYERQCPATLSPEKLARLAETQYSAIIVNSLSGLNNLYQLCDSIRAWLQTQPLIVVRETQVLRARALHHQAPIALSKNATNRAIIQLIQTLE